MPATIATPAATGHAMAASPVANAPTPVAPAAVAAAVPTLAICGAAVAAARPVSAAIVLNDRNSDTMPGSICSSGPKARFTPPTPSAILVRFSIRTGWSLIKFATPSAPLISAGISSFISFSMIGPI